MFFSRSSSHEACLAEKPLQKFQGWAIAYRQRLAKFLSVIKFSLLGFNGDSVRSRGWRALRQMSVSRLDIEPENELHDGLSHQRGTHDSWAILHAREHEENSAAREKTQPKTPWKASHSMSQAVPANVCRDCKEKLAHATRA